MTEGDFPFPSRIVLVCEREIGQSNGDLSLPSLCRYGGCFKITTHIICIRL